VIAIESNTNFINVKENSILSFIHFTKSYFIIIKLIDSYHQII